MARSADAGPGPGRGASRRGKARSSGFRQAQEGQMMLLAGFVFVIGLLATAAMLARVPMLAKQVSREQDRPIFLEASPMMDGLDGAITHLARDFRPTIDGVCFPYSCGANATAFDRALISLLEHLRSAEASRGFVLEWRLTCDNPADRATSRGLLLLSDGEMQIELHTQRLHLSKCYLPTVTGSWPHADLTGAPPATSLQCVPAAQTIAQGDSASFTAVGGTATYAWSSPGSVAPTTGSGSLYTARYTTAGAFNATVTSGAQTARCAVTVSAPVLTCLPVTQTVAQDVAANLTAALYGATSFSWSSPGGSPLSGSGSAYTVTYSAPQDGIVSVSSGGQNANCTVRVNPPLCSPLTQSVTANQTASLTVTGGAGGYTWSSPGSNAPTSGSGSSYTASYPWIGTFNVTVTSGSQSTPCKVTVNPPSLLCAPGSQVLGAQQAATFTVTGGIGGYAWSSPSGTPTSGSGPSYSTTYAASGSFVVTVTSGTQTSSCTALVNPLLVCSPSSQAVTVNAAASLAASGGNGTYSWSAPGGSPSAGTLSSFAPAYSGTGPHTVTLNSGTQSKTCTVTANALPTCSPASQGVQVGQSAALTATGGDNTYTWSSPSATPTSGSGASYSVSYASAGTYTVTVTSFGNSGTCTVIASVVNTYAATCTAVVGTVTTTAANCPTGLGASDSVLVDMTEGTVVNQRYGSTVTKITGTFSSTGITCASSGSDTSGNAKSSPDLAYACFAVKNDKLSVGGFTAPDQAGKITKVEIAFQGKVTLDSGGVNSNDNVNLLAKLSGVQQGTTDSVAVTTSDQTVYWDVTAARAWTWADLPNLIVEADASTHNNNVHLNIDALWVRVTIVGVDARLTWSAVPTNTPHVLQLSYKTTGDTFSVQLWDGSTWTTRGTLSSSTLTTFSYTMTTNEYQSGAPQVRFLDVTAGLASPAAKLTVDYARIASG